MEFLDEASQEVVVRELEYKDRVSTSIFRLLFLIVGMFSLARFVFFLNYLHASMLPRDIHCCLLHQQT